MKDDKLHKYYSDFIHEFKNIEYLHAETMESDAEEYYLPHHQIVKESSTSIKLRVAFDGSAKTYNGPSNETLPEGPNLQGDPVSILLRFRTHAYTHSADTAKLYRKVARLFCQKIE